MYILASKETKQGKHNAQSRTQSIEIMVKEI